MQHLNQLTFASTFLDRVAEMRIHGLELERMFRDPSSWIVVLWRGKFLLDLEKMELVKLQSSHCLVADQFENAVFLGKADVGYFAVDISEWAPDANSYSPTDQFIDQSAQPHPDGPTGAEFVDIRGYIAHLSGADGDISATARALFEWHRSHQYCSCCGAKSNMTMAGWQRNCGSCGASHFPRTDPVVIMLVTHGNSVLLGRSPIWPDGMYSLLAGFVEPGETLEAAVRREVLEETQVKIGHVSYLASQPWPFPNSLMIGCAAQVVSTEITIDPNEIDDALWVSKEEMLDVIAGSHPTIKGARKGSIAHFLVENWLADRLN